MAENWISLPTAIARIRERAVLSSIAAASARAIQAFADGWVRTRWDSFQGARGAGFGTRPAISRQAWVGADIPETDLMVSADGTRRRGITVNEGELNDYLSQAKAVGLQTVQGPSSHRRYASDDALVREGVEGVKSGKWANANKAATALASRAEGVSESSKRDRLGRRIIEALKPSPKHPETPRRRKAAK